MTWYAATNAKKYAHVNEATRRILCDTVLNFAFSTGPRAPTLNVLYIMLRSSLYGALNPVGTA